MDNNLNTSLSLTCIYNVLKSEMNDYTKYKLISEFDSVLSLDLTKQIDTSFEDIDDEVKALIDERNKAKENKDYERADAIRDELMNMGIKIKDTREGTTFERIIL